MSLPNWNHQAHDIFRNGPDSRLNACVGENGGPYDFFDYGRGYLVAAEALCDDVERGGWLKDLKIYPTGFLLRHAVELYMKGLLIYIPRLWGASEEFKHIHTLKALWTTLKPYLEREKELFDAGCDAIAFMDKFIADMELVDTNAQVFRYPASKDMKLHLAGRFTHLNYGILKELITHLLDLFECWLLTHDQINSKSAA